MALTDIFLAVASGGATGLLGTALGMVNGFLEHRRDVENRRLDMEAAVAERGHELRLHELNQQARAQETEAELAIVSQRGSFEGLTASIQHDQSMGNTSQWVNDFRSLFRPGLTLALMAVTFLIFIISLFMPRESYVGELQSYIVYNVVYVASAASLWWFGDRMLQRSVRGTSTHVAGLPWMNRQDTTPSS